MERKKNKTKGGQKKEISVEKEPTEIKKIKIKVVGIGGGGKNIVCDIAQKTRAKVSFLVADSDFKNLKNLPSKVEKFYFGESLTRGLGTGMDVNLGAEIARLKKKEIKETLSGNDLLIFVSTLGGGTGSGAGPVFAQIAKNLGILSYGIFTIPFSFEGNRKKEIALSSLTDFRKKLNAFSVLPNENIFKIVPKETPLKKAFSIFNKHLSFNLQNLIEIIFRPGLINIDFADLQTVLAGQGLLTFLNAVEFDKKEETRDTDKIVHSPLYSYGLEGAKGVLFNISGPRNLSLGETTKISRIISESVNKEAKIIFGISFLEREKIIATILATGCNNLPAELLNQVQKKQAAQKPEKKKKIKTAKEKETKKQEVERKSGLQLKKEIEKEEAKILEQEKAWEAPSFLRKKLIS